MTQQQYCSVLLVEDDATTREFLSEFIKDIHVVEEQTNTIFILHIYLADGVASAEQILSEHIIDLMFLDLNLQEQGFRGSYTYQYFHNKYRRIPIITISGYKPVQEDYKLIDMEFFVDKTSIADKKILIDKILLAIERRKLYKEIVKLEHTVEKLGEGIKCFNCKAL